MEEKADDFEVLPVGEMRRKYYQPDEVPPKIALDPARVPLPLRSLIPLAERWGISDDILRTDALRRATPQEVSELKRIVADFNDLLDDWLAGPEASDPQPSAEYIAFTTMRMAADDF